MIAGCKIYKWKSVDQSVLFCSMDNTISSVLFQYLYVSNATVASFFFPRVWDTSHNICVEDTKMYVGDFLKKCIPRCINIVRSVSNYEKWHDKCDDISRWMDFPSPYSNSLKIKSLLLVSQCGKITLNIFRLFIGLFSITIFLTFLCRIRQGDR